MSRITRDDGVVSAESDSMVILWGARSASNDVVWMPVIVITEHEFRILLDRVLGYVTYEVDETPTILFAAGYPSLSKAA